MLSTRSGAIPKSSDNQPKQICILIDTTTGMKSIFAYFLAKVIVPYMLSLRNKNTEFSAVLFQNYPPNGDFLVKVIPFIKDYSTFFQILEGLKEKFYAGGIAHSCVSEALATSITDLEWDKDALKYVMICSSTPSEHPCILNGMYVGKNAMEIVKDMVKKGIIISILSPNISRKWKKITEACKPDPQSMNKTTTTNDPFSISEGLSKLILDAMNLHCPIMNLPYSNTEFTLLIDLRGIEKEKLKIQHLEKNDQDSNTNTSNNGTNSNSNSSTAPSQTFSVKTEKDTPTTTTKLPPKPSNVSARGVVIPPVTTTVTTPPSSSFLAPNTAPNNTSSTTNTSTTPPTTSTTTTPNSTTATTPTNSSSNTSTTPTNSGTSSTPNSTGSTTNTTSNPAVKTISDYTIGPNHVQIHKLTFSIDSNSIIGHLEGYAKSEIVVDASKWPKDIKITKNLMSLKTSIIANLVKKDMKVHLWKLAPSTLAAKIPTLLNNMTKKKFFITAPIDEKSSLLLFPYQYLKIYFDKTKEQETVTANTIASEPVFVSFPIGTELIDKCAEKPQAIPNNIPTQPQPTQTLPPPNLNPPTTATTVPTAGLPGGYQNPQLLLSNPMAFPYNFVMPFNVSNMPNMPNMPNMNLPFNQPMYMVNGGMNLMNNPNNRNANNNNNNNNNNK